MMRSHVNKFSVLLPVFSMAMLQFYSSEGRNLFDENYIHEVRIEFTGKKFYDSLLYNYNTYHDSDVAGKDMLMASVTIDSIHLDSIGIKYKSNFSFTIPGNKKPMKIDFNVFVKKRLFENLRSINLSNEFPDPSMLRNTVAYKIFREAGIRAPRTSFAKVYINDGYIGLYLVVEQIDKSFIERNFTHAGGELIKPLAASLSWLDDDTLAFRKNYEIKSKNNSSSMKRLENFAKKINNTTAEVFFDSLKNDFDFDSYLPVFAADVIFNNWDSYFYGQNYYLYRDTMEKKYYYLPWDYNVSMNNYDISGGDFPIVPGNDKIHFFELPLPSKILSNKILRQKYFQEICRMNDFMSPDNLNSYILKMHNLIKDAMYADKGKIMTNDQFEKSLEKRIAISEIEYEGLLNFIRYRHEQIKRMLKTENIECEKR